MARKTPIRVCVYGRQERVARVTTSDMARRANHIEQLSRSTAHRHVGLLSVRPGGPRPR